MERLDDVVARLDALFELARYGPDGSMRRFVPMVYDAAGIDWRRRFEPAFVERFNGLMVRGTATVGTAFLSVFPTPEVLDGFLAAGAPGDLLVLHHPIDMECGDPRGRWGRGFLPIAEAHLDALGDRGLSVYACHVPMDYSRRVGTTTALAEALGLAVERAFVGDDEGYCGLIGTIPQASTKALVDRLLALLGLPYADVAGPRHARLERIAVVAGSGDKVAWMREAEALGAQAYVTGEIRSHIDNEIGHRRYAEMAAYIARTGLSLIGLSHAASEYLVMPGQLAPWLGQHTALRVELLPLLRWWR